MRQAPRRRPPGTRARHTSDDDVELWERAERYAKSRRMPVSGLVMAALEQFVGDEAAAD